MFCRGSLARFCLIAQTFAIKRAPGLEICDRSLSQAFYENQGGEVLAVPRSLRVLEAAEVESQVTG